MPLRKDKGAFELCKVENVLGQVLRHSSQDNQDFGGLKPIFLRQVASQANTSLHDAKTSCSATTEARQFGQALYILKTSQAGIEAS